MNAAVEVEGLRIEVRSGAPIVEDISFSIGDGEVLGLVGESGSGKSTVSLALLGYAKPGTRIAAGGVTIDGRKVLGEDAQAGLRGRLVTYVPQDPSASLNPAIRIGTQLSEHLVRGQGALTAAEAVARSIEMLAAVGLPADPSFLARYPSQLSGGQLQRVAIAMAAAPHPRLMVLDEPTTGLDVVTQAEVLSLVAGLCRRFGMAAVYVSHDLDVVAQVADRVMVLYAGQILEYGSRADVLGAPASPYTASLLNALPAVSERRVLRSIAGHAPEVGRRPQGCVFAPRCPAVVSECTRGRPSLKPSGAADHFVRCLLPSAVATAGASVVAPQLELAAAPRLAVRNVSAGYGKTPILKHVSLAVQPGRCLALVGQSGSGKSTLSRCIAGLHGAYHGTVELDGAELAKTATGRDSAARQAIQYIFQNPYGSLNPRRTIGSTLRLAINHFGTAGPAGAETEVQDGLRRAGLSPALALRYPSDLSGGERQRVAIARALVCKPSVLVCDEITSALDVSVQAAIIELLRGLMADGLSLLFVTHNLAVVRSLADDIVILNGGEVVEQGPAQKILDEPASDYARMLMQAAAGLAEAA